MGNVLIVVEQSEGQLRTASLSAVTFGKKIAEAAGGKLTLLVIGAGVGKAAEEAAKLGDERAAVERTALRFGNPAEVTSQLQESVPARDRAAVLGG